MISEDDLHNLYPKDNYYAYSEIKPVQLLQKSGLKQKLKSLIINTSPRDPWFKNAFELSMLDLGCGSGEQLIAFKNMGWKSVKGVEIDKHSCEIGKLNGLDIFHGTLTNANFPDNSFNYVRSNHAFEHIIDNVSIIKEMYRICKPGGKIFIGIPNTRSFNFKFFGRYWYYLGIPFHPYGYNPNNLKLLLENCGFKVEKIIYNGNALGILGSLQIVINSILGRKDSKGLLINRFLEIPSYQIARLMNLFRCGDCMEVIAAKPSN